MSVKRADSEESPKERPTCLPKLLWIQLGL